MGNTNIEQEKQDKQEEIKHNYFFFEDTVEDTVGPLTLKEAAQLLIESYRNEEPEYVEYALEKYDMSDNDLWDSATEDNLRGVLDGQGNILGGNYLANIWG